MRKLADDYEPVLLSWISSCDAETQRLLRPAVYGALNAVELWCPVAVAVNPGVSDPAIKVAYGPAIEPGEFVVFLASPKTSISFARRTWPEPYDLPAGATHNDIWHALYECVQKNRNGAVMSLLVARMGFEMVTRMQTEFETCRRQQFTPSIVALVTDGQQSGGGVVGFLPLPASIKTQLAASTSK